MSEKKEMTAVEYFKAKARLTANCKICAGCPLNFSKNGREVFCREFEMEYPEEAVAIIQKWAEEHPVKTRMSDFFEKHPNATKREDGRPLVCAFHIGYEARERCEPNENCLVCWNKPLEVKE